MPDRVPATPAQRANYEADFRHFPYTTAPSILALAYTGQRLEGALDPEARATVKDLYQSKIETWKDNPKTQWSDKTKRLTDTMYEPVKEVVGDWAKQGLSPEDIVKGLTKRYGMSYT